MIVHSLARWTDDTVDDGTPQWYGSGAFAANTAGFYNPTYAWSVPGIAGTMPVDFLSQQSFALAASGDETISPVPFPRIKLSTDPKGNNLPSTILTLTATDQNGSLDDEYTVQWHKEVENKVEWLAPVSTYTLGSGLVTNDSVSPTPPGQSVNVWLNPRVLRCGVLLTTGERVITAIGLPIVTGAPGIWYVGSVNNLAFAWAAFQAANRSFGHGFVVEAETRPLTNSVEEWNRAVAETRLWQSNPSGNDQRVTPVDVVLGSDTDMYYYFSKMTAYVKRPSTTRFTKFDEYGANGYVGIAHGTEDEEGTPELLGYYTYTGQSNLP